MNDITLFSRSFGSGFPLILLHGNGEDGSYFQNQIPAFSPHFRVIAVDTRGHGKSPWGEKKLTLGRAAEDLFLFMEEEKIERAHILGFSDGANIAMAFAARHRSLVASLILDGGNISFRGLKASARIPIVVRRAIASLARSEEGRRRFSILSLMTDYPFVDEEELRAVDCPTLVLAGERDVIRRKHTLHIASLLPSSTVLFLKGSHFVARENSEAFNRAVLSFLLERGESVPSRSL